jgi:hypothetical protein
MLFELTSSDSQPKVLRDREVITASFTMVRTRVDWKFVTNVSETLAASIFKAVEDFSCTQLVKGITVYDFPCRQFQSRRCRMSVYILIKYPKQPFYFDYIQGVTGGMCNTSGGGSLR